MPARSPGDPRALVCRYCGDRRRYVRGTLVCATCDGTDRWPAASPGPGGGGSRGAHPSPGGRAEPSPDDDADGGSGRSGRSRR